MFCSKCGTKVENGKFCPKCGNSVGSNTSVTPAPQKKSHLGLILGIVFGVLALFIIGIVILVVFIVSAYNSSSKMVCTSKDQDITITYNQKGLTGYTYRNMDDFDLDEEKVKAKQKGIDQYFEEYNDWFVKNTSGSCVIKDKDGNIIKTFQEDDWNYNSNKNNNNNKNNNKNNNRNVKVVGEDTYGYVEVPTNWVNFQDIEGGHSIQYSYGTTYIVTLDYVESPAATAKVIASSYYNKMLVDESVTGVEADTVQIGKTKKYTAYQVSMYYPSLSIYLVTYWFDAGDGNLHYIAIEGPEGLEEYSSIPESFMLTK